MKDLEDWYADLDSQVLDLVSDYAGRELFCLEGDSLVLECLDDPALDFQTGFQVLHAVYKVERFLSRLLSTKCHFHIVFFDENRQVASYAASKNVYRSKYLLAREIIFQHLNKHVQKKYPDIEVHQFTSIDSLEFRSYVQANNVYFVMCHNGALREKMTAVEALLRVICNMMALGLDVAIMNEIEWRDTKVMTRVIQASSSRHSMLEIDEEGTDAASIAPSILKCMQHLQSSADKELALTPRDILTMTIASSLLNERKDEELNYMVTALILQLACLKNLSLSERRFEVQDIPNPELCDEFMDRFSLTAATILRSPEWQDLDFEHGDDLHDIVDGRVIRSCLASISNDGMAKISSHIGQNWHILLRCFQTISNHSLSEKFTFAKNNGTVETKTRMITAPHENDAPRMALLPFKHDVFDKHLESVHVDVESSDDEEPVTKIVQDNKHWHNCRPLDSNPPKKPITKWNNPVRWGQIQSRDMDKYAASLTNSKGRALDPERIISKDLQKGQSKENKKSAKAEAIIKKNEAEKAEKVASLLEPWKQILRQTQNLSPDSKIREISSFLEGLDGRKRGLLEPEVRLRLLSLLLNQYQTYRPSTNDGDRIRLARKIWDEIRTLKKMITGMSLESFLMFQQICKKLGLPDISQSSSLPKRSLSFSFDVDSIRPQKLGAPIDFQKFQLTHCGPFMDRQTGAQKDKRVEFEPDKWQRDVLDELDQDHSIFVVAPTSAGKTFISFYAMSKILKEDDTGVLVYVAPTKALVNQIAAEIHARFRKKYPESSGKTIWAIHTRDTRINNPMKCQILVTVPHILQIMLLSPTNAKTWSPRVKCIIFDEIHSIGQADDGLVWEQLLLLAPCRIIALSATVGNPTEFAEWLSSTQKCLGNPLKLIQYRQRYSDLRKYFYDPPKNFNFQGLLRPQEKEILEPGSIQGLQAVHPATSLNQQRQMPEDLSLEPRDCYMLWESMMKHSSETYPVPERLNPKQAMPSFIRRSDVSEWEAHVKNVLSTWIMDPKSPFEKVKAELRSIYSEDKNCDKGSLLGANNEPALSTIRALKKGKLSRSVFPLLVDLHRKNALPALLFNYERTTCELIASTTLQQLLDAEDEYKKGSTWKKTMAEYEKYKLVKSKQAQVANKNKKSKRSRDQDESTPDPAEHEIHHFEGFDPERPLEAFTFANTHSVTWVELMEEVEFLKKRNINGVLLEALKRGIGVHHAGMNRRYRQCVERLFRAGFLRVVVATGTLALGINMPCSTVIFCGDSVYLTALNFRQAAGRAGRRGFDVLGNVIFHGIPCDKAYQLISSRLPDLNGHFPITTSLVLRLFILLHNSEESPYAVRATNSLLSQPRLFFGSAETKEKEKVLHHLRFSIEYLRRQKLLGKRGEPIHLACSVAHLYYTENSAFAFHALLHSGYFERLCESNRTNTENRMRTLMVVLCHLFGRRSLGHRYAVPKKKSPSIVVLPNIPAEAAAIIRNHNEEVLKIYAAYVSTYTYQHLREPEGGLPLSGMAVSGQGSPELSRYLGALETNRTRSAFVGLSGHDDEFKSIKDLCQTVRSGVFLEEGVIPHLDIYPDGGMAPLNAYLYDFFSHGSLAPLESANHISRSDAWFLLSDFSLILATIIVALQTYIDPESEQNPLDISGVGDDMSESDDEDIYDETAPPVDEKSDPLNEFKSLSIKTLTPDVEEEVPDDWDEMSDSSESSEESSGTSSQMSAKPALSVSLDVLKAFRELKEVFDEKFHAIFA